MRSRMVVWAGFSSAVVALATLNEGLSYALAAVGAVVALTLLDDVLIGRFATALGIALAGLGVVPPAVLLAAGVLVAVAAAPSAAGALSGAGTAQIEQVQRHLARARRRAERAHVLLLHFQPRDGQQPAEVLEFFRVTDSVSLRANGTGYEVLAVLDDHEMDRDGLQRRISTHLASDPAVGWASFPEDGYTLGDLLQRARTRQSTEALRIERPSTNGHHKARLAG